MKKIKNIILIFPFVVLGFFLNAQIPQNYYLPAGGLTGIALKTALYNIIKNHNQYQYTADTTDVWDILKQTDKDPNNPNNVIEIYTGLSVNAAQEYNNGNGWEREHIWAKVHGGFDTNPPAGTDVHHIRPINGSVNGARNSRYFANCTVPYSVNGIPTGSYTSTTQWVWKPRNEDKGDIARMIFYMAVRYEGENGEPDLEIGDSIPADNNDPAPIMAKLSDLMQWNIEDPVDNWERNRNDIIYTYYQHNRNPFIDHPEYANSIWGTLGITDQNLMPSAKLFPNPVIDQINIQISSVWIGTTYTINDQSGRTIQKGKLSNVNSILELSNLSAGFYIFSIGDKVRQTYKLLKE